MVKVLRGLAVVLISAQALWPLGALADSGTPAKPVLISEFQSGAISGGVENPKGEFVELYNPNSTAVDLTGWRVDYLTKTHDGVSAPTRILATLSGTIDANSHLLISYQGYLPNANFYFSGGPSTGYLAKGDGTIRLVTSTGGVVDLVGYGKPNNYEELPVNSPDAGKSLQRCLEGTDLIDTDNNGADFALYDEVTPGLGVNCPVAPTPVPTTSNCSGVILSELLPNPAGTDGGQEFIELYNPTTDYINLAGCGLQYGSGSIYRFGSQTLAPEEYRAFTDDTTGITLTNSTGGTVYLLSNTDEELSAANYSPDLPDDVSWAWFGDSDWHQTYVPTPDTINIDQPTKPCGYGEVRNPDTGRCVSLGIGGSSLKPCQPNQVRNPDTNRCRLLTITARQLVACKPGQERNPATNRCRAASTSNLKPCKPGQQRNPDTNRCRKVVTLASSNGGSGTNVQDISSTASPKTSWWFGGIAFGAAAGYGVWEWRKEILGLFKRPIRST